MGAGAIRVLGSVEVAAGDGLASLGGSRRATILALLVVEAGTVVSVDRLLEEVWDGAPPTRARDTLQAHLAHLRRALADAEGLAIERVPPGYVLHADPSQVDAQVLAGLAAEGRSRMAAQDHAGASAAFEAALAVWGGRPYSGVADTPTIEAERLRLERLRSDVVEGWAEAALALGRGSEVTGVLEELLRGDPWRERATGLLMTALHRAGRQVDALAAYQRLRVALADELGLLPSPDLRALEASILQQSEVAPSPEPAVSAAVPPADVLPFVGRTDELAALTAILRATGAGARQLAVVRGEPGIGKSRLVRELALAAPAHGVTVLLGRCDHDSPAPYQPFLQAIGGYADRFGGETLAALSAATTAEVGRVVPQLAGPAATPLAVSTTGPSFARLRMFESIASVLRSIGPAVMVLDDVHAADAASLALLRHLVRSVDHLPLSIIVTARDREPGSASIDDLVSEAGADGIEVVQVTLGGLDAAGVAALVHARLGDRRRTGSIASELLAATGGNPFSVRELLREVGPTGSLDDRDELDLPGSVSDAIAQRVARLGASAQEVLRAAAVLGAEFDLDVLAAVVGREATEVGAAVEAAIRSGLLAETPTRDRFRFGHALHRWALLEELSASRRVRLHHGAGTALAQLRAGDLDNHLAELANHFTQAAQMDGAMAVVFAQRAGEHAMAVYAFEEAERHLARAVGGLSFLGSAESEPQRLELLLRLGEARNRIGDLPAAKRTLLEAAEVAERLARPDALARAALLYGGSMTGPIEVDRARIELVERALAVVDPTDLATRARLLARLADALEYAGDPRVDQLGREAVALARESEDDGALAAALYTEVNRHFVDGEGAARLAEVTELAALAEAVDDIDLLLLAEAWRLVRLIELGEAGAAETTLGELLGWARRLRQPFYDWAALGFAAMLRLLAGALDDAEALSTQAMQAGLRVHPEQAVQSHLLQMVAIRWHQGRLDELAPVLAGIGGAAATVPGWVAIQTWLHHQFGDLDETRERLATLSASGFVEVVEGPFWLPCTALVAEVVAEIGSEADARLLYGRLLPVADEAVVVGRASVCLGATARYLGLLARRLGDLDQAEAHLEAAWVLHRRLGARAYAAAARCEQVQVLLARDLPGDRARAAAMSLEAQAIASDLGLTRLAEVAGSLCGG